MKVNSTSRIDQPYIMEDPREKRRLREKVDAEAWVEKYLSPRLTESAHVLDVGCGPAVIAASAAQTFSNCRFVGLEQSDDRFDEGKENVSSIENASVVKGNAVSIPLEEGQFDLTYSRLMLEYLKDPEIAISEMVRVTKPGGRVMLQDLDGQLVWHYPMDVELKDMIEQVVTYMGKSGFDPFIGRKLFTYAKRAGLSNIQVEAEPYHFYAGKIDPKNEELWALKLDIALPIMEEALGSARQANQLREGFLNCLRHEDSMTYSTVFTVTGTK